MLLGAPLIPHPYESLSFHFINMGKKKGKRIDLEKKAALQAKKEAKANKAATKRLSKEARALGEDVDVELLAGDGSNSSALDELLKQYRIQDEMTATSRTEILEGFPAARSNSTLTLTEDTKKKNAELYLFGGEYYDGVENIVLNQLYRYDINKNEWKLVVTPPPHPPPRCAHTTAYYNNCLYVFGGEMATTDEYHHYRDLWKYDTKQQTWTELSVNKKATGTVPPARSGHASAVWKHFLIIFGGFYEALRDTPRWYNDVTVFDLQTEQWMDIPHSKLATRPEARSACNVCVVEDKMIVHGGFSKLDKKSLQLQQQKQQQNTGKDAFMPQAETKVHTDSWILHLKPLLTGKPPVWERLTSSVPRSQLPGFAAGNNKNTLHTVRHPGGRSGTASVTYKDRMLVYGGVVDTEQLHHKIDSVFYNDLFCFDIERRKWFPIHVKTATTGKRRRKDNGNEGDDQTLQDQDDIDETSDLEEDENDANEHTEEHEGWNLEKLRSNMFAFIDGSGNLIYEKIEEENEDGTPALAESGDEEEEEEEKEEEKEEERGEEEEQADPIKQKNEADDSTAEKHSKTITSSSVMTLNPETKVPEAVFRADPLPRIKASLIVSGHTLYVYGGLLEVGDREVTLDDLWSFDLRKRDKWNCLYQGTMHKQVWRGAIYDDDDSYVSSTAQSAAAEEDEEDSDEMDAEYEDYDGDENEDIERESKKKKKSKRSDLRQEIAELNEKYGVSDMNRTPEPNEALADFYSRTSNYWNDEAAIRVEDKGDPLSAKELKREGFILAQERYNELSPIMERLQELDLQKEEKKERKASKKEKESSSKSKSKNRRDR